jgi:hypothetical protein
MVSNLGPYRSAQYDKLDVVGRISVAAKGFALDVFSPRVRAAKLMLDIPNLDPLESAKAVARISKSGTIEDCFALFSRNLSFDLQNLVARSLVKKITDEFDSHMHDAKNSETSAGFFAMQNADRFLADQKSKVRTLLSSELVTSADVQKILSDFASS